MATIKVRSQCAQRDRFVPVILMAVYVNGSRGSSTEPQGTLIDRAMRDAKIDREGPRIDNP